MEVERWPILLMVRELGIGGCERDLTKLAKRLDRARFEPHVGCFRDEGLRTKELREAAIPIVRFPVTSFRSFSLWKGFAAFRRYVRTHRIRLLHTFDTPTNIFGITAAKLIGLRPRIASQLWFLNTIERQFWWLHRLSLRWADAVVVNSHAVERELLENKEATKEKIFVSHNGVETAIFHPGIFHPASAARPASFRNASIVIGAVCALRAEKRMDLLLDAFAKVKQKFSGAKLLIVGSGEMLPALQRQRANLRLNHDCVFQPAQREVADWIRAIDVFVMASESESFPNALLEAAACGCCLIGSNVGGVPELIVDGESGLLFRRGDADDLSNKLFQVLNDPELRVRLARNAVTRSSSQFSIEIAVERMERLYAALITGGADAGNAQRLLLG